MDDWGYPHDETETTPMSENLVKNPKFHQLSSFFKSFCLFVVVGWGCVSLCSISVTIKPRVADLLWMQIKAGLLYGGFRFVMRVPLHHPMLLGILRFTKTHQRVGIPHVESPTNPTMSGTTCRQGSLLVHDINDGAPWEGN